MSSKDSNAWHNNFGGIMFTSPLKNYFTSRNNPFREWYGLSKINLVVGPNNSGKSKLLRHIMVEGMNVLPNDLVNISNREQTLKILRDIVSEFERENLPTLQGVMDKDAIKTLRSNIARIGSVTATLSEETLYQELLLLYEHASSIDVISDSSHPRDPMNRIKSLASTGQEALGISFPPFRSELDEGDEHIPMRVYIPVLRGLRTFDTDHRDFYADRIKQDYTLPVDGRKPLVRLFTGTKLHESLTRLLLGNLRARDEIAAYQNFLSEMIFDGQPVALIPAPNQQVTIKIGKEREQEIQHLGDGLQSIIVLTYLPFLYHKRKMPAMFFMEEPELFLHPGSQRRLLEVFTKLDTHIYFITTHSNHLLDLTIDYPQVTVTSVRKNVPLTNSNEELPQFTIQPLDNNMQSSLALLGIRNSSVFLVNATVWVEGITDRWYFRRMLDLYMEHLRAEAQQKGLDAPRLYREDTHYSFVEYGGTNIVHFSFLDSEDHPISVETLCGEAMVILDKDGNNKTSRQARIKRRLGDNAIVLARREVENLLSTTTLRKVIAEIERLPLNEIPTFTYKSYENEYLGTFIESKVIPKLKVKRNTTYTYKDPKVKAGTIRYKVEFCKTAVNLMKYAELSEDALTLAKQMYDHIEKHNAL